MIVTIQKMVIQTTMSTNCAKIFQISAKYPNCLQTNLVQESADPCPVGLEQPQNQNNNKAGRAKTDTQNQNNNKFKTDNQKDSQKLPFDFQNSKAIVQDNPTLPDAIRQGLIAKHQRSLGLVGYLERFEPKTFVQLLTL